MGVHHVGDFSEKQAFGFEHPLSLMEKWRIEVTQVPVLICTAGHGGPKGYIKSLAAFVTPLRPNVRRIVDHNAVV